MSYNLDKNVSAKGLFNIAQQLPDYESGKLFQLLERASAMAHTAEDYELLVDVLTYTGRRHKIEGSTYECLSKLNAAYRKFNLHLKNDNYRLAQIYRELANVYGDLLREWDAAIEYSEKCLQLNVPELNGVFYNNCASNLINSGNVEKAYPYLVKGEYFYSNNENAIHLCYIYENYGEYYKRLGDYEKSLEYYNLGLAKTLEAYEGNYKYETTVLIRCHLLAAKVRLFLEMEDYVQASENVEKLRIENIAKLKIHLATASLLEGEILYFQNKYDAYLELFNASQQLCIGNQFYSELDLWYKRVQEIHEKREDYKAALEISKKILAYINTRKEKSNQYNISNVLKDKEVEILELVDQNRSIQIQKEEIEQFTYIMTHDLKTPLSTVINYSGLLLKKAKDTMTISEKAYINTILNSSNKMADMLQGLMDYVIISDNKEETKLCKISEVVVEIKLKHYSYISNNRAVIEASGIDNINIKVSHLYKLLEQLILNSIKFSNENVDPFISLHAEENELYYQVHISDNGIGVDESFSNQVFQIFNRLDPKKYKGVGVGLSICRKIVNLYNGNIWCEGNEGGGSIFKFTISKEKK